MKISRLRLYMEVCTCLGQEPTVKELNHYDRCVDIALREMASLKRR